MIPFSFEYMGGGYWRKRGGQAAPRIGVATDVNRVLIANGVSEEAVQNQAEVALRRCGFTIVESGGSAIVAVDITGLSHKSLGYSGYASVKVVLTMMVNGEGVLILAFEEGFSLSGPPGDAASRVGSIIAQLLDKFCNAYLQARDEVRSEKGKQP